MSQLAAHNLAMSNFYGTHQADRNGLQKEDTREGLDVMRYVSMIVGLLSLFTIIALNVTNIIYMTESGGTMQSIKSTQDSIGGSVKEMFGTMVEDIKPKTDLINTMVSYNIPSQLTLIHQLIRNDVLKQCTPSFLFNNTICPVAENPTHTRYFEEVNLDSISECGATGGKITVRNPIEFIEYPSFAPTSTKPDSCVRLPSFSLSSTIFAYTHTIMGHGCSDLDIGDHYLSIGRIADAGTDIPHLETISSWFIDDKINRRSCTVAAGNMEAWMGCVIMTETFYDDLNSIDTGKITISYLDVFGRKKEWIYTRSEIMYDYTYTAVYFSIGSGMVVGDTVYFLIWGSLMAPIENTAYCVAPGCTAYDQRMCNEAQRPPEYGGRQMVNGLLRFKTDGTGKPVINVRTLPPSQIPFGSEGRLMYSDITKIPYIYIRSTSWHSLPLTGMLSLGGSLGISWTKQEAVSRPGDYPCGASNRCPKNCVTGVYTDLFPLGSRFEYSVTAYLNAELYRVNPNIAVINTTDKIYQRVVTSTSQRAGYTTTTCFVFKLRIWCLSIIEMSPGTITSYEPIPFLYHLDLGCTEPGLNKTTPFSGDNGSYKLGRINSVREECYFEYVDNRYYFVISTPNSIQAYVIRNLRDDQFERASVHVTDICAPLINAYKQLQTQARRLSTLTIGNWQFRPVQINHGVRIDLKKEGAQDVPNHMLTPEDPGSGPPSSYTGKKLVHSLCENVYATGNGTNIYEVIETDTSGQVVRHYDIYNPNDPLKFGNDAVTLSTPEGAHMSRQPPISVKDDFGGIYNTTPTYNLPNASSVGSYTNTMTSNASLDITTTSTTPTNPPLIHDYHYMTTDVGYSTVADSQESPATKKGSDNLDEPTTGVMHPTVSKEYTTINPRNDHRTTSNGHGTGEEGDKDPKLHHVNDYRIKEYNQSSTESSSTNLVTNQSLPIPDQTQATTVGPYTSDDYPTPSGTHHTTAESDHDEGSADNQEDNMLDYSTEESTEIAHPTSQGEDRDTMLNSTGPATSTVNYQTTYDDQHARMDTEGYTSPLTTKESSTAIENNTVSDSADSNHSTAVWTGLPTTENRVQNNTATYQSNNSTDIALNQTAIPSQQTDHSTPDTDSIRSTDSPGIHTVTGPTSASQVDDSHGDSILTNTHFAMEQIIGQRENGKGSNSNSEVQELNLNSPTIYSAETTHTTAYNEPTSSYLELGKGYEPTSSNVSMTEENPNYTDMVSHHEGSSSTLNMTLPTTHLNTNLPQDTQTVEYLLMQTPQKPIARENIPLGQFRSAEPTVSALTTINPNISWSRYEEANPGNIQLSSTPTIRTHGTDTPATPHESAHASRQQTTWPITVKQPTTTEAASQDRKSNSPGQDHDKTSTLMRVKPRPLTRLRTNRELNPEVLTAIIDKSDTDSSSTYQTQPPQIDVGLNGRMISVVDELATVDETPSGMSMSMGTSCNGYVSKTVDNINNSHNKKPKIDDLTESTTMTVPFYMCTNASGNYFEHYSAYTARRGHSKTHSVNNLENDQNPFEERYYNDLQRYKLPVSKIDLMLIVKDIRKQGYDYACTAAEICGYPIVITQKEGSSVIYYLTYDKTCAYCKTHSQISLETLCENALSNYHRTEGEHDMQNPVYLFTNGLVLHPLSDHHYASWTRMGTFCSKKSTMGAWGYYGTEDVVRNLTSGFEIGLYDPFNDVINPILNKLNKDDQDEQEEGVVNYVSNVLGNWWG
nr:MAG: attachment glycoprotein [Longquan rodent jeilongvirus 1]